MYPLDHTAIAVPDLDEAIKLYEDMFSLSVMYREKIESQQTEAAFLKLPNTYLELLAPLNNKGPVHKFLSKRGPGLHHLCFRVNDIEAELTRLANLGYRLIDSTPRTGAFNARIAFIHPKCAGGVLIELCQYNS